MSDESHQPTLRDDHLIIPSRRWMRFWRRPLERRRMDARDRSPVSRPTLHRRLSSAEQYRLLCADIAARLRPVCPTFSEAEFETLVQDIAAVKLRHPDDEELSTVFDRARQ